MIMNYETKYKQALEKASKLRVQNPFDTVGQMVEYIFPELAESEDERIRKELIQLISYMHDADHRKKDWLAWLEKQGEHKGLDYPNVTGWRKNYKNNKPKVRHSVLMLTTHGVAEGEWLGEEWCQYRWSCKLKDEDVLYWLHLSDLENIEKKIEL